MHYTYSHLEDFIRKIYQELNIHSPTQLNIYTIANTLNIGLYPISTISQSLHFDGRHYIFLNNGLTAPKRFETFAHEVRPYPVAFRQPEAYEQEWKANLFALHFCVPTFMLQIVQTPNAYQVSETFGVRLDFAHQRLDMYEQRLQRRNIYGTRKI